MNLMIKGIDMPKDYVVNGVEKNMIVLIVVLVCIFGLLKTNRLF